MDFVKKNLKYLIIFGVLIILLILGSFFDLQISKLLADLEPNQYYSKNIFAVFFEIFGEMPIYIVPSIALGCLYSSIRTTQKISKKLKIIAYVLIVVALLGLNYYGSHKLLKYLSIHICAINNKSFLEVLFGIWFSALWVYLSSKIKSKNLKAVVICSLIVVLTAIFSQVIVQLVKPLFGRARYRLMNITGDFSEFSNWYQINIGKKVSLEQLQLGAEADGYKSFPSGHTAGAGVVFALMAIPVFFNVKPSTKIIINLCTLLFVAIVAFSRIVMGAHYLTDVTMGAIITMASYLLALFIVTKLTQKYDNKNTLTE